MHLRKSRFFIVSMAIHASVLLVASMQWNWLQQETNLGSARAHILTSYIYQESVAGSATTLNPLKHSNELKKAENVPKKAIGMAQQNRPQVMPEHQTMYASKKVRQAQLHRSQLAGNNRPVPALVSLLHAAIQKQQRYPASALQMEREGNTTVTFVLLPTGFIKQLKIIQSSGTAVLDEAAIAAIHHALPFKGIDKHLVVPQVYQITVAFELA